MPSMIATPVAISESKEQEMEQEFELDIRVSSVSTFVPQAVTANTGGCCTDALSCFGCGVNSDTLAN